MIFFSAPLCFLLIWFCCTFVSLEAWNLCLLLVLRHVLVGEEGEGAADEDDGVEADAHVGLAGAAAAG